MSRLRGIVRRFQIGYGTTGAVATLFMYVLVIVAGCVVLILASRVGG